MAKQIKTITDRSVFEQLCNKYFTSAGTCIKTKNGDLEIKFFGYSSDGSVAFRIPYIKNIAEKCLIIARSGNNTIHANVKFLEKQEDDMFIFTLENLQIINEEIEGERKAVDGNAGKEVVFVTGVISDFIIQNILSLHIKKIDELRDSLKMEVGNTFKQFKIFFVNEGTSDVRMKFFQEKRKIIYIPDINKKDDPDDREFNYYINNIYARDFTLQKKREIVSEISIPVMYKTKLPYGYIQANHEIPLNRESLKILKRIAVTIDAELTADKFFPQADDKLLVSNISKDGFGIVFKERRLIRYFKTDSYAYLDMLLPDNKRASILAIVRNISIMENKIIKVGLQIIEIDALSEVYYQEYIEKLDSP